MNCQLAVFQRKQKRLLIVPLKCLLKIKKGRRLIKKLNIMKKEFPYQIHIILGLIWLLIGAVFHSGIELAIWVAGGLVMITIGLLNRRSRENN